MKVLIPLRTTDQWINTILSGSVGEKYSACRRAQAMTDASVCFKKTGLHMQKEQFSFQLLGEM